MIWTELLLKTVAAARPMSSGNEMVFVTDHRGAMSEYNRALVKLSPRRTNPRASAGGDGGKDGVGATPSGGYDALLLVS